MGRALDQSLASCGRFCRFAAGAALAVLLALIIALQFARYLSISLPWADELARMTFVWMVALGAAAGLENRAHFALSFFAELAPPDFRSVLERSFAALTAGMLLLLLVALTSSIAAIRFSMMPGTGLSRAWLQAPLVVFAALGACFMAGKSATAAHRYGPMTAAKRTLHSLRGAHRDVDRQAVSGGGDSGTPTRPHAHGCRCGSGRELAHLGITGSRPPAELGRAAGSGSAKRSRAADARDLGGRHRGRRVHAHRGGSGPRGLRSLSDARSVSGLEAPRSHRDLAFVPSLSTFLPSLFFGELP